MSLKKSKEELELLSNKDIAELILEDSKKTLNDDEVMQVFNSIIEKVEKTHNAILRDK